MEIKEPTAKQCSENALLSEDEHSKYFAVWYPQMGGYVSKTIVRVNRDNNDSNDCFDVWIYHDGDWPFHDGEHPLNLHHCCAEQFIRFGEDVLKLQGIEIKED